MSWRSIVLSVSLGLALVSTGTTAMAAPTAPATTQRKTLINGLSLVVDGNAIHVVKGKQRARLELALGIKSVVIDKQAKRVAVTVEDSSCAMEATYVWSIGFLEAKLANTAAYVLHKKHDYKGAAAGFAKAVAADPSWNIAAYNLASAQQQLGDQAAAIRTLTPWLANEPIATYVQVTSDPELAPLLARPEVQAVRAKQPGTLKLTQDAVDGYVAYAPERKLVAVVRNERSWGACVFENDLEIFDLTSATPIARTPLVTWDETGPDCDDKGAGRVLPKARKAVAARVSTIEAMLRELGFQAATTEVGTEPALNEAGDKTTASIVKAKLGVVLKNGVLRVFQGNTELGMIPGSDRMTRVVYVKDISAVGVFLLRPGAEGCEGTDPTRFTLVKIASPKP